MKKFILIFSLSVLSLTIFGQARPCTDCKTLREKFPKEIQDAIPIGKWVNVKDVQYLFFKYAKEIARIQDEQIALSNAYEKSNRGADYNPYKIAPFDHKLYCGICGWSSICEGCTWCTSCTCAGCPPYTECPECGNSYWFECQLVWCGQ